MSALFVNRYLEVRRVYVSVACGSEVFWAGVLQDFDASRFDLSSEAQASKINWAAFITTTFEQQTRC